MLRVHNVSIITAELSAYSVGANNGRDTVQKNIVLIVTVKVLLAGTRHAQHLAAAANRNEGID